MLQAWDYAEVMTEVKVYEILFEYMDMIEGNKIFPSNLFTHFKKKILLLIDFFLICTSL